MTFIRIEPVEAFLAECLHPDALIVYQEPIQWFTENNINSALDVLNAIVADMGDQSPNEKVMEIRFALIEQLTVQIKEYDIIVETDDINFLFKFLKTLSVLDEYPEHQFIYNTCILDTSPFNKLYEIISIVMYFDEQEYGEYVKLIPMSFIERLAEEHLSFIEKQEETAEVNFNEKIIERIKKVNAKYPNLYVFKLIDEHRISAIVNQQIILTHARDFCAERQSMLSTDEMKHTMLEILALYAMISDDMDKVKEMVRQDLVFIFDDEKLINQITTFIPALVNEVFQ